MEETEEKKENMLLLLSCVRKKYQCWKKIVNFSFIKDSVQTHIVLKEKERKL